MVGRDALRVVGKVLDRISGLEKTESMEIRITEVSGNRITKSLSSRKNSKKGFTLVELIVVLVIMAIIAAIAIPIAMGYIDNTKEKKYITEADACLKGTQTALNDVFNDSSNELNPDKRASVPKMANVNSDSTEFKVWTEKKLEDYVTPSTQEYIGSYTVAYALYKTTRDNNAIYVFYDGKEWMIYHSESEANDAISAEMSDVFKAENVIYMWPYTIGSDYAYTDNHTIETEVWPGENPDNNNTLSLILHKTNIKEDHGVVICDESDPNNQWSDEDVTVSFIKEDQNVYSHEWTEAFKLLKNGIYYDIACESGFSNLKWSLKNDSITSEDLIDYNWVKDNFMYLKSLGEPVDLYAWTTKEVEERTVNFRVFKDNNDTLGSVETVTFRKFKNSYDSSYSKNKDVDGGRISVSFDNLEPTFDGYNTANRNYYDFEGWAFYNGSSYDEGNNGYIDYNEQLAWERVFEISAQELSDVSFDNMINVTQFTVLKVKDADFDSNVAHFTGNQDSKELEITTFNLSDEVIKNDFDSYNSNMLEIANRHKFLKWEKSDDTSETFISVPEIEAYVVNNDLMESEYEADFKERGKALLLANDKGSASITSEISTMAGGTKEKLVTFNQVSDWTTFCNAVGTDLYVIYDKNTGLGKESSGYTTSASVNGNSAVYVLYDGSVEGYDTPVFAYTKTEGGNISAYWYCDEAPEFESGSYEGLFNGYTNLNLSYSGIGSWNTTGNTSFKDFFNGCSTATALDVASWNTSNATDMSFMFKDCSSVSNLNVSGFVTSGVTTMESMFEGCSSLSGSLNVSTFATSSVTTMENMFKGCSNITTLNLTSFATSGVTSMVSMFEDCTSLTSISVSQTNFKAGPLLTDVSKMFKNCKNLNGLELKGFGACNISNISEWFYHCDHLKYIDLSLFAPEQITSFNGAFYCVGNYDGDTTSGTKYDLKPEDGCAVFASGRWNCAANKEDDTGFDYFRLILYGKLYKNTDPNIGKPKTMTFEIVGTNPKQYENITVTKKGAEHLAVSSPNRLYTAENKYGNPKITNYENVPVNNIRACTGYFNDVDSDYYRSNDWKLSQ
ncbi:prepilin-type N-terminal cleavage/methylation domain-containing protein [Lachnospiraceae bacterium]|nr:prepilin-type N-terminal cleavage/methylation domain-containing protein [Lachnospiraceae bacterium]